MIERELDYHPITGPAVDRYNARYDGDGDWTPKGKIISANPDYDRPPADDKAPWPHPTQALVPVPVTIVAGQSKKWSRYEAGAGTVIGFIVGVTGNIIFLPLVASQMGVGITAAVTLTLAFMVLSYVRQYSLRRFFNWLQFRE